MKKLLAGLTSFFKKPEDIVNIMTNETCEFIRNEVLKKTEIYVGYSVSDDLPGQRYNVGLLLDKDYPSEKITAAQKAFLNAAAEKGHPLDESHITYYLPDGAGKPYRMTKTTFKK